MICVGKGKKMGSGVREKGGPDLQETTWKHKMRRNKDVIEKVKGNCTPCHQKKKLPCTINPFFLGSDKLTFHAEFRSTADSSKYNFSFERPEHNDSELN